MRTSQRSSRSPIGAIGAAAAIGSWWWVGFSPREVWQSREHAANLLQRSWPPRFDGAHMLAEALAETVVMALAATVAGTFLALPLGSLAAKSVTGSAKVAAAARAMLLVARACPEIVLAAMLVRVYSIGPVAGILAITFSSVGMQARFFADSVDNASLPAQAGVAVTGASRLQVFAAAALPQSIPSLISIALLRFDLNLRSASILGLLGAGGIGVQLDRFQGQLAYGRLLGAGIMVGVLIVMTELASSALRKSIARPSTPDRDASRLPVAVAVVSVVATVVGLRWLGVSPRTFLTPSRGTETIVRFVPQSFDWWRWEYLEELAKTFALGIAAASAAMVLAVPVGLLAARNLSPVSALARVYLASVRAVPFLIVAVLLVSLVGLGPQAGVLALAFTFHGFVGKLLADAFEEANPKTVLAVQTTGASRLQAFASGIVPAARGKLLAITTFSTEAAIRTAPAVGLVGAGGIGLPIARALGAHQLEAVGGLVLILIASLITLEIALSSAGQPRGNGGEHAIL